MGKRLMAGVAVVMALATGAVVPVAAQEACLYPAVTLVSKASPDGVVLAGTSVCLLYMIPGAERADGAQLIAVLTAKVAGSHGATNVVVHEMRYYSDELKGK